MERRKQRSDNPIEATKHLLTQAKTKRSYRALNLTNSDGELYVGAPTQLNNSAISMVVPVAGEGSHQDTGLLNLVTKGEDLQIWRIPLEGDSVFLCAVGGPSDYPTSTIDAIRRILLEHQSNEMKPTTSQQKP